MTGKKQEDVGLDAEGILKRLFEISGARNEAELARCLGVGRATLNAAKLRDRLPYRHIVKAAMIYKRSVDWILWGDENSGAFVSVPLYEARLSAGGGSMEISSETVKQYAFRAEWLRAHCRYGKKPDVGLLRVSGDSMEPLICGGDMVLIDFSQTNCCAGQIYAVAVEGMIYLKRIDTAPGELVLKSENPQFEPIRIPTSEDNSDSVRIMGKCIWICREI